MCLCPQKKKARPLFSIVQNVARCGWARDGGLLHVSIREVKLFEFPRASSLVGEEMEDAVSSHAITEVNGDTHERMRNLALDDPVRGPMAIGDEPDLHMQLDGGDEACAEPVPISEEHWKELTVKVL